MTFTQPITDLIRSRFSCRKYRPEPIPSAAREALRDFLQGLERGPFGSPLRLDLVSASDQDNRDLKGLGTYGFIQGATAYIIGAAAPAEKDLEDYGYCMEKAILFATDLGLGTCWLGGTFTRSNFAQKIALAADEIIPAVTATGLMDNPDRSRNGLVRQFARGKTRLPREQLFFMDDFSHPLTEQAAGDFSTALEMIRLAPSASNRQPWRIVKATNAFHFYLSRTPGYREGFFQQLLHVADIQRVDMGIAMCHFELTAREMGLPGEWVLDEPGINLPGELTEYTVSWRI
jgi:nitroreductase